MRGDLRSALLSTKCAANIGAWEFVLHPSDKYADVEAFTDWESYKARLESLPPFGIPTPADNWAPYKLVTKEEWATMQNTLADLTQRVGKLESKNGS